MASLSFLTLLAAGAVGLALWLAFLRDGSVPGPPGWIAGLHGVLGALGLSLMLFAPLPAHSVTAAEYGVAGFHRIAVVLLLIVLAIGILILWWRRRARPPGVVVAAHAGTAITALVVLAA